MQPMNLQAQPPQAPAEASGYTYSYFDPNAPNQPTPSVDQKGAAGANGYQF